MQNFDQIKVFLSMFAMYLPTLAVSLAAVVVILIKWRQASSASLWALLGFGLALALCFVMPAGHTLLQHWVIQSGQQASRVWAFTAFGLIGSVLHAVIYALLLVAIFAGRTKPEATIRPSLHGP
jgi:hypothetical protein